MNPCGRVAFTCVALPSFPISCQQKVAAPFQSAQERTPRFDEPANLAFQESRPTTKTAHGQGSKLAPPCQAKDILSFEVVRAD
jgi:hypothetical protein